MAGPKKTLTQKDMDDIDLSKADNTGISESMIQAKKNEFLGGDDDDLKHLGFMDSDDEIDFTNFKVGTKTKIAQDEEDEIAKEQAKSIFSRLTSAIQNMTGNRVLTKADVDGILDEFKENLTDKNVSAEIADEICNSVRGGLVG